ncbi:FH3 [Symbiodinium sp. KB8]|nr:FH3 [Symbiodinium sp. KB8]
MASQLLPGIVQRSGPGSDSDSDSAAQGCVHSIPAVSRHQPAAYPRLDDKQAPVFMPSMPYSQDSMGQLTLFGRISTKTRCLSPGRHARRTTSPVCSGRTLSPRRLWTNSHGSSSEANLELPASTRTYFSSPGSLWEASPRSTPKNCSRWFPEHGEADEELPTPVAAGSSRLRPGELDAPANSAPCWVGNISSPRKASPGLRDWQMAAATTCGVLGSFGQGSVWRSNFEHEEVERGPMVDTAEGAGTSALVDGGIPVGEHPGVGRCAGTVPVLCPADIPGAQQRAFAMETSGSLSGDRAAMNETDETYANAAHGMLKTGRQGKPLGQLDRIMAAGPAQQESFSKSPGTRGAPDRKEYPGGKARAGPASHPLHLSAGSGSHSKTAQSFAQTPRLPAKTVYKSWPAMGSPVYNSRTVPGEGDALQDGHDGLHLTSALPKVVQVALHGVRSIFLAGGLAVMVAAFPRAEPVRDEYAFVDPSDAETAKQASSDPSRPCTEGSQAEAASSPAEIAKIEIKEGHSGDLRGASAQDKGPPVMTDLPLVIDANRSKGAVKGKGKGKLPPPAVPKHKGDGKKGKGGAKGDLKSLQVEEEKVSMRKAEVIPTVQVKRIFWNPIHLRAQSSTVWDLIDDESYCIDLEELERLFAEARSPRGKLEEKTGGGEGKRIIRVFDEQRRRQICIMIARLPGNALKLVNDMNALRLGRDEVELLLQNCPSAEETHMLRRAQEENVVDENNVWDTAEEFMLSLLAIPRVQLRLKVWGFVTSFQDKFEHVAADVTGIISGCRCLLSSIRVRHLLGVALHAGNFLNGGTRRGRADGFAMEALLQLRTVKATQAADETLLHFITLQMEKQYPGELSGLFSPGQEADWIRHASRRRIEDAAQECSSLLAQAVHMLKTIRLVLEENHVSEDGSLKEDPLQHFGECLSMCVAELEALQGRIGIVNSKYEELCEWLHIDVDHRKPSDELFGIWQQFLEDLKAVRRLLQEKEEQALRRQRRPLQRKRRQVRRSVTMPNIASSEEACSRATELVPRLHLGSSRELEDVSASLAELRAQHKYREASSGEISQSEVSSATSSGEEGALARLGPSKKLPDEDPGVDEVGAAASFGPSKKLRDAAEEPPAQFAQADHVQIPSDDKHDLTQTCEKDVPAIGPSEKLQEDSDSLGACGDRRGSAFQCLTRERLRTDGVFEMAFAIPSSPEQAGFDPGETAPRISRPAGSEAGIRADVQVDSLLNLGSLAPKCDNLARPYVSFLKLLRSYDLQEWSADAACYFHSCTTMLPPVPLPPPSPPPSPAGVTVTPLPPLPPWPPSQDDPCSPAPLPPDHEGRPSLPQWALEKMESAIQSVHEQVSRSLEAPAPVPELSRDVFDLKSELCEQHLRQVFELVRSLLPEGTAYFGMFGAESQHSSLLELFRSIDLDTTEHQAHIRHLVAQTGLSIHRVHPVLGVRPIEHAILHGRRRSVRTLMALGASIASDADHVQLYHAALQYGLDEVASELSAWARSPAARLELFASAHSGDTRRCGLLLHMKANANWRDETGMSVLEWAMTSDNRECGVEEMLLPLADDAAKQSALQICALHGLTTRLYILLDAKCDPSSRDDDGWTPLDWAILHGQEMFALELLRLAGPAVAHACHRSTKALARAARNRHLWQLAELLEFEPLATAQAAFRKILEDGTEEGLLELLLQGNFPLNPQSDFGHPLDACVEGGRPDLALQLLRWQAQPSLASGGSLSLLARARAMPQRSGHIELVNISGREHGSSPTTWPGRSWIYRGQGGQICAAQASKMIQTAKIVHLSLSKELFRSYVQPFWGTVSSGQAVTLKRGQATRTAQTT